MTDRPRRLLEGLGLDLARRIDALCRRFEVQLAGGAAASHRRLPGRSRRRRAGGARAELEALEHELRRAGETMARTEPAPIAEASTIAPTRCAAPADRGDRLETCASVRRHLSRLVRGCFGRSDRSAARATPVFQTGPSDAADTLKPGPSASPGRRETHALAFTNASGGEGPPAVAARPKPCRRLRAPFDQPRIVLSSASGSRATPSELPIRSPTGLTAGSASAAATAAPWYNLSRHGSCSPPLANATFDLQGYIDEITGFRSVLVGDFYSDDPSTLGDGFRRRRCTEAESRGPTGDVGERGESLHRDRGSDLFVRQQLSGGHGAVRHGAAQSGYGFAAGQRASNSSGYYYPDQRILGFSHTRLAGTGATDGGNFLVIPCTAETAKSHRRGLNSRVFPSAGTRLPGLLRRDVAEPRHHRRADRHPPRGSASLYVF